MAAANCDSVSACSGLNLKHAESMSEKNGKCAGNWAAAMALRFQSPARELLQIALPNEAPGPAVYVTCRFFIVIRRSFYRTLISVASLYTLKCRSRLSVSNCKHIKLLQRHSCLHCRTMH